MSAEQNRPIITSAGKERLQNELDRLVTVRRPEVAEVIRNAREIGDVVESGEYAAAMSDQALLDHRISELRSFLSEARVLEPDDITPGQAGVGSVITLRDLETDDDWVLTLVSSIEADPEQDLISVECPLGQALQSKQEGERVRVDTPGGPIEYEILSIGAAIA